MKRKNKHQNISYAVLNNKSWRKRIWPICEVVSFHSDLCTEPIFFCSRNAALNWLKRYGSTIKIYNLRGRSIHILNGNIYFYNYGECAEPKRMCVYGKRNN